MEAPFVRELLCHTAGTGAQAACRDFDQPLGISLVQVPASSVRPLLRGYPDSPVLSTRHFLQSGTPSLCRRPGFHEATPEASDGNFYGTTSGNLQDPHGHSVL